MHIKSMRLSNWVCFAGTQPAIELRPISYAVVASRDGSQDASNWSGKSTFLRAPYFALYGEHSARTEDGWLTHGANEGGVELEIEGGPGGAPMWIRRTRKRGKSTQLVVEMDGKTMKGDEAQQALDHLLGLSREDFVNTAYFEQRQLARMVLAKPQERMDIVTAWLRLDPLVRAEEIVRADLASKSAEVVYGRGALQRADEQLKAELGGAGERDGLAEELRHAETALDHARRLLEQHRDAAATVRKVAVQRSKVAEYDRIAADGKLLVEQLGGMDLPALTKAAEKAANLERDLGIASGAIAREVLTKRMVARGQFDGSCPVASIECPAKESINRKRKDAQQALAEVEQRAGVAHEHHEQAAALARKREAERQEATRIKQRVEAMRDQIRSMHDDVMAAKKGMGVTLDLAELEALVSVHEGHVLDAQGSVQGLRRSLANVDAALAEQVRLRDKTEAAERELETLREGVLVFGKTGAQRRVAEAALRSIEDGANEGLRECGIDLSVEVQWSRQGDGLAKACDSCGQPFPSSVKVKRCERCGAERGPLLVNRLELQLSDRSGAAEDLVGAALQLSASAWLRGERGSAWSTCLIDEPYGALDAANRRALATYLASTLRGRYGMQQSFIVSHTIDTVGMAQGRVEIVNHGGRATVRVTA